MYEKGIALAAFGGGNIIEDPNLFFAVAIVQPGHTTDETANALIRELDRRNSVHPRHDPASYMNQRHFVFMFQDSTLECVVPSEKSAVGGVSIKT